VVGTTRSLGRLEADMKGATRPVRAERLVQPEAAMRSARVGRHMAPVSITG
jgi:hypothetical protein